VDRGALPPDRTRFPASLGGPPHPPRFPPAAPGTTIDPVLAFLGNLSPLELIVIVGLAVLIFGKNLPQAASKAYLQARKLRNAVDDLRRESGIERELREIERNVREAEWEARRAETKSSLPRTSEATPGTTPGATPAAPPTAPPAEPAPTEAPPAEPTEDEPPRAS